MSIVKSPTPKGKRPQIPAVYPITNPCISGLTHLEQVKRLVDGGASLIQLREKDASPREFYRQAVLCIAYARSHGAQIVINDRADIAAMCDADGVHLGQDDMPPQSARELLGPGKIIGYSTHSMEQAISASAAGVDYIAIGPVFDTTTKANPDPTVGPASITAVKTFLGEIPLVAIGGIDLTNIAEVLRAGADSAAVISGALKEPDQITTMMESLLAACGR